MNALVLAGWSVAGILIAAQLTPGARSKWAWAHAGAVLGPLWYFVAIDMRHADDVTERPASHSSRLR